MVFCEPFTNCVLFICSGLNPDGVRIEVLVAPSKLLVRVVPFINSNVSGCLFVLRYMNEFLVGERCFPAHVSIARLSLGLRLLDITVRFDKYVLLIFLTLFSIDKMSLLPVVGWRSKSMSKSSSAMAL